MDLGGQVGAPQDGGSHEGETSVGEGDGEQETDGRQAAQVLDESVGPGGRCGKKVWDRCVGLGDKANECWALQVHGGGGGASTCQWGHAEQRLEKCGRAVWRFPTKVSGGGLSKPNATTAAATSSCHTTTTATSPMLLSPCCLTTHSQSSLYMELPGSGQMPESVRAAAGVAGSAVCRRI